MFSKFDHFHTHKRSRRLKGFDYSKRAAYFVTIRLQTDLLLGDIIDEESRLNEYGRIVREEWLRSESMRDEIFLDEYIVMPDHLHGIVVIAQPGTPPDAARDPRAYQIPPKAFRSCVASTDRSTLHEPPRPNGPRPQSLSAFVGGFKAAATARINQQRGTPGSKVWQRSFNDHIIRDECEWWAIRQYIRMNPERWDTDGFGRNRG